MKVAGTEVTPRALTLPELRSLGGDLAEQEVAAISLTCGLDREAVEAWYNTAPAGEALAVVKAMWAASGVGDDASKSGAAADDAGAERDAI